MDIVTIILLAVALALAPIILDVVHTPMTGIYNHITGPRVRDPKPMAYYNDNLKHGE